MKKFLKVREVKIHTCTEETYFEITNNRGQFLGNLDTNKFNRLVFYPAEGGTWFSEECLMQIAEKLAELNNDLNNK